MIFEFGNFDDLSYLAIEELKTLSLSDGIARILLDDWFADRIAAPENYKTLKLRSEGGKLIAWSMLICEQNANFGLATVKDGLYMCYIDPSLRRTGLAQNLFYKMLEHEKTAKQKDVVFSCIAHDVASRNFYMKIQEKSPAAIHINHWIY